MMQVMVGQDDLIDLFWPSWFDDSMILSLQLLPWKRTALLKRSKRLRKIQGLEFLCHCDEETPTFQTMDMELRRCSTDCFRIQNCYEKAWQMASASVSVGRTENTCYYIICSFFIMFFPSLLILTRPFFFNSSQLQESRWREPTNRNKQFPLRVALEQFSVHLSWLCTSEVSTLCCCSLPSAGSSWACLWKCFNSFVVAVYASDMHLRPCVCLRYLHVHVTFEKSRAHQWALGADEPCNHLALCSRFPWGYSCSSWWGALHLKGFGSE